MRSRMPDAAGGRLELVKIFEVLSHEGLLDPLDEGTGFIEAPLVEELHDPIGHGCELSGVLDASALEDGYVQFAEEHASSLTHRGAQVK